MNTVHLHLGLAKTGSTFFQKLLLANEDKLEDHIFVLNRIRGKTNGLLGVRKYVIQNRKGPLSPDGLLEALRACPRYTQFEADPEKDLVISDEALGGHLPGQGQHYAVYPNLGDVINSFRDAIHPNHLKVHILFREKEAWIKSLYNQAIKNSGCTLQQDEFFAAIPDFTWSELMEKTAEECRGVDINWYEMEKETPYLAFSIVKALGLPTKIEENLTVVDVANVSWPPALLEMMRRINSRGYDKETLKIFYKEFNRSLDIFK